MKRFISVLMFTFTVLFSLQNVSFSQQERPLKPEVKEMLETLANRTPAEKKLEGGLFGNIVKYKKGIAKGESKSEAVKEFKQKKYRIDTESRVFVVFRFIAGMESETKNVENLIKKLNGIVYHTRAGYNGLTEIGAQVPVEAITEIAERPAVGYIWTPSPPSFRTVTSAGDIQLKASDVRAKYGIDGSGIKVGIISDGAQFYQIVTDNLELPKVPPVTILNSGSGAEGTAMMEIVHDIAPGAQLYFSGTGGTTDWLWETSNGISNLRMAGCKIIVDDTYWTEEPFFSDDNILGDEIRQFIQTGGIYVSAAGNDADNVFDGYTSFINGYNRFSDGKDYLEINFESINSYLVLQWKTRWTAPNSDLDLEVYDQANNLVEVYGGKEDQSAGAPPLEVIYPGKVGIYHIKIKKQTADDGIEFKIVGSDNIPNNGSNHIYGHSAYPNVVSVAAYHLENGQLQVASYSSRGPATMYSVQSSDWTTQNVPTIIATSGVQTYVGSVAKLWKPGDPLFYGTSAAAPHVAGIAALYLQASSRSNLDFIQDLKISATTMPGTGTVGGQWNNTAGFGLANALETINRAKGRVATPIFSPNGGTYYNKTTLPISISCATSGATIRYTCDPDGEVTSSSPIYDPRTYISITGSKTIKAKAFMQGMLDSFTSSTFYEVKDAPAPPSGDKVLWELKPSVYRGTTKYVSDGKDFVDWDIYIGYSKYCVGTGDFYGGTLSAEVSRPFYQ